MQSPESLLDSRHPEVRVEFGMARAEFAFRAATRAVAEQHAAIHATLAEARAFPEIFVGAALLRDPGAVEFAVRAAVADLAVRLSIAEQTVRAQDHLTQSLLQRAPRAWALFREGDIPIANVRVIADLLLTLPEHCWVRFEDAVLDRAAKFSPARFRTFARATRERIEPEQAAERHAREAADRRVWIEPDLNGMSLLCVYGTAEANERAFAHIEKAARHLAAQPDEQRTLAQLRADVAGDLMGGVLGAGESVGVTVGVTVPVMSLLGLSEEPATLDGFGPIDAQTARRLCAHAPSFFRILTHPVSSAVVDVDRTSYRVPADLRRLVELRDKQCSFIGCGRSASACDIDHTIPWQHEGTTSEGNLTPLCRNHHRVKHNSGWHSEQSPDGTVTWTSPTGFTRVADPPPF